MTDDDIKAARALCADPPEQDGIDPPICPACGDEYILDNDNGTQGHMMCDPCGAEAFDKARTLLPALLDALAAARRERDGLLGERYEMLTSRDALLPDGARRDLAATKAALAEAMALLREASAWFDEDPRYAVLKAKAGDA